MNSPIVNCQGEVMQPEEESTLGPCPHCGKEDWVYQAARAVGKVQIFWDESARRAEVGTDRLRFVTYSDAVRCCYCHHIRRDWLVIDGRLVRGEG